MWIPSMLPVTMSMIILDAIFLRFVFFGENLLPHYGKTLYV